MFTEIITSTKNLRIKHLLRLREKRIRDRNNETIADGSIPLKRGFRAGIGIREVYVCSDFFTDRGFLEELASAGIPLIKISKEVYQKVSFGQIHDGILAVIRHPDLDLASLRIGSNPLIVVAAGIEKPGNLGAIIRSADGAGADAVIVADHITDPFNPNVIRASLGAVFTTPLAVGDATDVIAWLKECNINIVAATPEAASVAWQVCLNIPIALVIGSEHDGVSELWKSHADFSISLPMHGIIDSLNASVTASILLYEVLRQRNQSSVE